MDSDDIKTCCVITFLALLFVVVLVVVCARWATAIHQADVRERIANCAAIMDTPLEARPGVNVNEVC